MERTLAEEVVTSLNKLTGRYLSCYIDLHKWEDTAPGFGRPQAIINQMVDDCDLFVGLLWERWGQPTGEYSSGFEEEYERARARRKAQDGPQIWLVFREVDPSKLKDPGDQLKRVIDFRNSQVNLGEVLFKDVRDAEDWKTKLHIWLLEHVLKLDLSLKAEQHPAVAVPISGSPNMPATNSAFQAGLQTAVPQQLKTISDLLGKAVHNNELEFFSAPENILQEFDVARLFLLSATLMSSRSTGERFGTHEMNLFYKHRERLEMTATEEYELFRTITSHGADVVPGWFWFRKMEAEKLEDELFKLATLDSSDDVQRRALDLLAAARIKIPQEFWPALPLDHDSLMVRGSAFDYLDSIGDESTLTFLEKLTVDSDPMFSFLVPDTRLKILTRLYPGKALSEVIAKDEYVSDDHLRSLEARISEVSAEILLRGTESSWEQMRKLSLKELMRRGSLPIELAQKFAKDPALAVRAIAFQSLACQAALPEFEEVRKALTEESSPVERGLFGLGGPLGGQKLKSLLDVDSIIVTFYCTQGTTTLLESADWYSIDGPLAYRALALDRFDIISSDLRADLASGFERIKTESSERRKKKFGAALWSEYSAEWGKFDEFTGAQFTKSALIGLVKHAQMSDAALVRPYLTHDDSFLRDLAVTIISRTGNANDVNALLKIAREAYGSVMPEAAAGALKLSPNPVEIARELIKHNSVDVVEIGFRWMFGEDSDEIKSIFEELMHGADEINRLRAIYYFSRRLEAKELEKMLNEYMERDTHYYNIVTWLDRLLYSPPPLRDSFIRDLEQKAN